MARTVNEAEHNAKRDEILDVAMKLVFTKGYEQMTIQDILDALNISRGALYHYFDSKLALLEAMIERSGTATEQALRSVAQDPNVSAVRKIQSYFDISTRWKSSQRELIFEGMRSLYSDENVLILQKMTRKSLSYMSRLLEPIIRQGIREGLFHTPHPAEVAAIFAGITLSLSDRLVELMLTPGPEQESLHKAQAFLDAYRDSVERVLGAAAGSFKAIDVGIFKGWFVAGPSISFPRSE